MVGATADLDKSPRRVPGVRWPLPIGGVLSTRGNVRRALFRAFGKRKPFVFTHAFLVHGRRHASTLVLCGRIKRMRCCVLFVLAMFVVGFCLRLVLLRGLLFWKTLSPSLCFAFSSSAFGSHVGLPYLRTNLTRSFCAPVGGTTLAFIFFA